MTATSNNSFAGPSRLPASSSSSTKRPTFYPVWPETHDEAEYFEVPPDHFLAQQRGSKKQPSTSTSDQHDPARRSSTSSSSSSAASAATIDASMPVAGFSDASNAALLSSSPSYALQPLSELANAIRSGIPAAPSVLAPPANPLDRLADAVPRPAGFSTVDEQIPDTSTLAAADFDVDVRSGFLPPEAPVQRLAGPHADHWEHALDEAKRIPLMQGGGGVNITPRQRLLARRWRRSIREMPVLPLSDELANDIRYARRGHVVLSFLAHFYIHSQPPKASDASAALPPHRSWLNVFSPRKSSEDIADEQDLADELSGKYLRRVPASIAIPWVQLSQKLDLPPVLTYATTVLWNWDYIDPSLGLTPSNLRIVETFTGTPSEHHFFYTSLLIEARGVEALDLMRVSLDEAFVADRVARRRIAGYLNKLAGVIKDLTRLLAEVREACDPKVFYWGIRPWFVGSDTVEKGEEAGWHFEGVDPEGVKRTFSGPSAGQSSMIHAIDVFLDVDHTRRKERLNRPASAATASDARGADATFMERMSLYMPGHHRAFLSHLRNISFDDRDDEDLLDEDSSSTTSDASSEEEQPRELPHPIRSLALTSQLSGEPDASLLPSAYDAALTALKGLRDEHMKIAYLYIVSQARGAPPPAYAPLPKGFTGEPSIDKRVLARAEDAVLDGEGGGGAKGTGGTDLVSFLRDCRVNTIDALIMAKEKVAGAVATIEPSADSSSGSSSSAGNSSGQSTNSSTAPTPPVGVSDNAPRVQLADTSAPFPLVGSSDVQIWAVNISSHATSLPESHLNDLVSNLLPGPRNAADRSKVLRYYKHLDRIRSLVARLLPRLLISRHFDTPWESIQFSATPEGRPYVAGLGLDYNISHDSDWVVMAFTLAPNVRVGVDVMSLALPKYESSLRSFVETMDMALTDDETIWVLSDGEEEGLKRLFALWTHKEAYTKNLGKGLGFDFKKLHFDFPKDSEPGLMVNGVEEKEYQFFDVILPYEAEGVADSQIVVCQGPQADLSSSKRFGKQISAEEAKKSRLLHTFDLKTILDLAHSAAA